MPLIAPLHALLWDVDGTLIDNEELHRQAFNAAFAAEGLGWCWDEACYAELLDVTGGRERIAHFAARHDPERAVRVDFADFAARLHAHKTRLYGEMLTSGAVELRPGVARLIEEAAAAGLAQAVVSATRRVNVDALLRHFFGPTEAPFIAFATGDRVMHKKPAPDLYQLALTDLGVEAAACVAIEDSAHGVRSARAAGVSALVTPSRYTMGEAFPDALAVVDHLGDPGFPSRCLQGQLNGDFVDLAQIRRWHRSAFTHG